MTKEEFTRKVLVARQIFQVAFDAARDLGLYVWIDKDESLHFGALDDPGQRSTE